LKKGSKKLVRVSFELQLSAARVTGKKRDSGAKVFCFFFSKRRPFFL
jgi:hypothetical protein